jgi:hypothetical protein
MAFYFKGLTGAKMAASKSTLGLPKLYKLKKWLTLDDASKILSVELSEEVTIADLLQLGLEGHLTLSVNLFDSATAFVGEIKNVPIDFSAEKDAISEAPILEWKKARSWNDHDEYLTFSNFKPITKTIWAKFNHEKVVSIQDVWDLPLTAGERISIEAMFQSQLGNMIEEKTNIDGTYLISPDKKTVLLLCQNLNPELGLYKKDKDGKIVIDEDLKPKPNKKIYYPIGQLPEDAQIVVRPSSLDEFKKSLLENDKPNQVADFEKDTFDDKTHSLQKVINNLERIIGAMLYIILNPIKSNNVNQDSVISTFEETFNRAPGLSKSNLEKVFPAAKKAIQQYKPDLFKDPNKGK